LVSKYLHYLLRSDVLINEYKRRSKNLPPNQFDLPWEQFRDFEVPLPSIEEQRRIADYLDEQVGIIESTLQLKQHQVESYLEVHDSNKNQLIWGDENSSLSPLRYTVKCNTNSLGTETEPSYRFTYCDVGSVNFRTGISQELDTLTYADAPSRARRLAKTGDVLFSMVRPYLRAVSVIPDFDEPHVFSTAFAVLEPLTVQSEYLFEVLTTSRFLAETEVWSSGMGYPAINQQDLMGLRIPIMNKAAQLEKISLLAEERDYSLALVDSIEKSMEHLREYKTSLITAAVTGQFDVTTGRSVA
jgi:type I restriction enzyme S subunit